MHLPVERLEKLEDLVREIVSCELDDLCWLDVYGRLAAAVGVSFDPLLLGRDEFLGNCGRFYNSLAAKKPYDKDALTAALGEHREAASLLRQAGFGVGGASLLNTVREAVEEVNNLRQMRRSDAAQEGGW